MKPGIARGLRAVGALVVLAAVGAVIFGFFGVAGWRGGWALALLWFAGFGAGLAWKLLDGVDGQGWFAAAVVVMGATAAIMLSDRAPESSGRLQARLDGLELPFYEPLATHQSGNSACRPTCPAVTRTYRGPYVNRRAGQVQVAAALHEAGLLPDIALKLVDQGDFSVAGWNDDVAATAKVSQDPDGRILAEITLRVRR